MKNEDITFVREGGRVFLFFIVGDIYQFLYLLENQTREGVCLARECDRIDLQTEAGGHRLN